MDVLKVKFTHSNTVRDKKPYTIYEIEVRSSSTITWVIYKRYSGFYALHQELLKSSSLTVEQKNALPMLPPKRLTRSLAVEFVEKRKNELQEYLRAILVTPGMVHSPVVLSFLEVPDSVRPMLLGAIKGNNSSMSGVNGSMNGIDSNMGMGSGLLRGADGSSPYAHKTYEERRVLELINLLKFHPNKVSAVKSFEDYFFEQRPRFNNEFIRLLLQGKSGADGDGGLVQTCGDVNYSHVASRAALYLLCRLLDVEKNKDAQLFLDQFCSLDVSVLRRMQLHQHIISERGNRLGAFRIISILRHNVIGKSVDYIDSIVNDQWALREYFKWAERKSDQVVPYSNEPQDTILKSITLDVGYKNIASHTFLDILKTATHDDHGWRAVTPFGLAKNDESVIDSVGIAYKKDSVKDMVIVRIQAVMPYRVDQVSGLLTDLRKRKDFDLKFHKGKLLQMLDNDTDVVHLVFKSFSSPYKYRDFCVLRAWCPLDNGGRILACRSVLHPSAPESKENVRAVLFPTGYILTPLQDQIVHVHSNSNNQATALKQQTPSSTLFPRSIPSTNSSSSSSPPQLPPLPSVSTSTDATLLTFIGQLDKESVLIVSPDLLGETNELRQSIHNMNNALAAIHGVRTLRPSVHTANIQNFSNKSFGNLLPTAGTLAESTGVGSSSSIPIPAPVGSGASTAPSQSSMAGINSPGLPKRMPTNAPQLGTIPEYSKRN